MTTTQATANATGTSWATRLAKALTEVFAPIVLIVFLLFAVTIYASADWRRGVLLAGIAAFFVGVLPYTVMLLGIRAGRQQPQASTSCTRWVHHRNCSPSWARCWQASWSHSA